MRILFTTYSDRSLLLSMVPLAWALRSAGHDVRVASTPNLTEVITNAGLPAVPVGRDDGFSRMLGGKPASLLTGLLQPYDVAAAPERAAWEYLHAGYESVVPWWHRMANVPMIPDLVDFARQWRPHLVLWEPTTFAGAIAAEASGAAHGRLLWSLDVFGVTREHYLRLKAGRTDAPDPLAEWLGTYAERYGFAFSEELITGSFTIDQLPDSMRMEARLRYLPMQYMPYGGPAAVPEWLRTPPARPRVGLTLGITNIARFGSYNIEVRELLDALADLDMEIVATITEQEQRKLGSVPGNTRLVPYVPLQALAPTCSALIQHGGPGTLLTTARHAVPQLVLPWEFDAPELARRFAAQGAGISVEASRVNARTVRENLLRLLEERSFRDGAVRLRDEMRTRPTPLDLVPVLEDLATSSASAGRGSPPSRTAPTP
ncbi:activator-dependent family glycosyltransferase (plasmid) [Streptomyces atratus]|uniref:Glycosyltransferase, activator-dependent family n=1 Tax=Streptomyces atratus TaxID=1893 RepID=A0A1K1ZS67_STRAR|nr:activator-dependent family glycosyltransferase [Streptomyces atratus]SFX77009.1 glycosyltransferase, activator-dependent family [Streptomyces atratus]